MGLKDSPSYINFLSEGNSSHVAVVIVKSLLETDIHILFFFKKKWIKFRFLINYQGKKKKKKRSKDLCF